MRIPRYWERESCSGVDRKGKPLMFRVWGWSFENPAEARKNAAERARRVFERARSGEPVDSYDYLEHPLREEVVDSVKYGSDEIAVITRNGYGALVLNCASVCFVDVDFPKAGFPGLVEAIILLFSRRRRQLRVEAARDNTLRQVQDWAERNPDRSFRLYRTAAGLRLLFTDRLYQPTSNEIATLLRDLGSDLLYRRLTEKQECFRARLTPKPWRCGCPRPPTRYPWLDADAERAYRQWQHDYEMKSDGYATCELLQAFGDGSCEGGIDTIISVHDEYTCREPEAGLA